MSVEASRDIRLSKSLICTLPELKVSITLVVVLFFLVYFYLLLPAFKTQATRKESMYLFLCVCMCVATGIDFKERRPGTTQCRSVALGAALRQISGPSLYT